MPGSLEDSQLVGTAAVRKYATLFVYSISPAAFANSTFAF